MNWGAYRSLLLLLLLLLIANFFVCTELINPLLFSRCLYGSSRNGLNSILSQFLALSYLFFSLQHTIHTREKKRFLESPYIALNSVLWGFTSFLELKVSLCFYHCHKLFLPQRQESEKFSMLCWSPRYGQIVSQPFSTASLLQSFIQTLPEKCCLTFHMFPWGSLFYLRLRANRNTHSLLNLNLTDWSPAKFTARKLKLNSYILKLLLICFEFRKSVLFCV